MNDFPSTRHSLLVRLRNPQDEVAWREFVSLYEPLVYGLARNRGFQDSDARDLCQDVFRAVAGAIDRWEPTTSQYSFRKWLLRIARNLMLNFFAQQRRHPRGSGSSDLRRLLESQPSPNSHDSAWFDAEYKRRVFIWAANEVRDQFAVSTWQAFWLSGVEGQPVPVVASKLGISIGAVYTARSRVFARIRDLARRVDGADEGQGEAESW